MKRNEQGTVLFKPTFNQEEYLRFLKVISEIYSLLSKKISDSVGLSEVIENRGLLKNNLKDEVKGKSEPFTREIIIDRLLDYLGFDSANRVSESELKQVFGYNKYPDYKLLSSPSLHILVEAEPLNSDIFETPGQGLYQVYDWLDRKKSKTDYGIATNGFEWVLVQYLVEADKKYEIKRIDLRSFFVKLLDKEVSEDILKEIFTDFYSYFSRKTIEAAINGYVKAQSEKREDISKKFYERYLEIIFGVNREWEKIYDHSLYDAIRNVNNSEDKKKIAQITVNRLIFIKFIESKGWINGSRSFLKKLKDQHTANPTPAGFYKTYLEPLFFLALNNPSSNKPHPYENVRYLNGGLFRKDKCEECNQNYDISNDELLRVIDFLEEYEFKIKGSVVHKNKETLDPEILGYIFERTANHEAGAYYTPENITTYIANQTLDLLLLERVNIYLREKGEPEREDLYSIFGEGGLDVDHIRNLYEKRQILNIRILDPACGSGAFFIPVIRKLVDLHRRFFKEINRSNPDTYHIQKKVVEENIYGVDINEEAVEIAKLRLWLDLLDSVQNLDQVDALPNIEYNVMAGNSLIGAIEIPEISRVQFYTYYHPVKFEQILETYSDLKKEAMSLIGKDTYFEMTFNDLFHLRNKLISKYRAETHPVYSARLRDIIEEISVRFRSDLTRSYFHKLMDVERTEELISLNKTLKPFNWVMEYSDVFEQKGFDVIIGNPPYMSAWTMEREYPQLRERIVKALNEYKMLTGHWDLYIAFIALGHKILKEGGVLAYIVPNALLREKYAEATRKFLLTNTSLKSILAFSETNVFENVARRTSIFVFQKRIVENYSIKLFENTGYGTASSDIVLQDIVPKSTWLINPKCQFLLNISVTQEELIKKIESSSERIGNFFYVNYGAQVSSKQKGGFGKKDVISKSPIHGYKKFFEGKDVQRWHLAWRNLYLDYREHEIYGPRTKELFEADKIVVRKVSDKNHKIAATLDHTHMYCDDGCVLLVPYNIIENTKLRTAFEGYPKVDTRLDLRYALAMILCSVTEFYFKKRMATESLQGSTSHTYPASIRALPIKAIPVEKQKPIIEIVDKIFDITKDVDYLSNSEKQNKVKQLKEKIDLMALEIFDIHSDEEKKIIEDNTTN